MPDTNNETDTNSETDDTTRIIKSVFNSANCCAIVGDGDEGKSHLIYFLIQQLKAISPNCKIRTFGLKLKTAVPFYSLDELERIKNSIVFIDEFESLFKLRNGREWDIVENVLRFMYHNNNVLVLCGQPHNFNKFISAKIKTVFFKGCVINGFVNGSRLKYLCLSYRGEENGIRLLNIPKDRTLIHNGTEFVKMVVPYNPHFDTKKNNAELI